jgi:translocation and assembly module TamB
MRRAGKIALWVAGTLVLVPVVSVVLVLIAANTGPGRHLIETEADRLSGGMIKLTGLSGRFPDSLRLASLEVNDTRGAWLTAKGVSLDWSPSALLFRRARIDDARIAHLSVARLPVAAAPAKPAPPGQPGFSLPVAIDLRALHVPQCDLGAPVAGEAASLQLEAHANVASLQAGSATIDMTRRDGPGRYHVDGVLSAASVTAHVTVQEPQGGLIAAIAKLPGLGGLAIDLSVDGPKNAERAHVVASAGALQMTGDGKVDLPGQTQDVTLAVTAPAMQLRPDIAWKSVDMHAHVTGSFTKPDAASHLAIDGLLAGGASLTSLVADVTGNQGQVSLHAVMSGTRLPGPKPDLLASAPLDLTGDIRLDTPSRPVRFKLTHTLLTADGTAQVGGDVSATIHTAIPDMAPFAAIGHVDLRGSTDAIATLAMHHGDADVGVTGKADFTGGQAPVPDLLGKTTFAASASLVGQDITIHDAQVNGRALRAGVTGTDRASGLDLAWHVALSDLSALSPQLLGALTATGHVSGPTNGLAVTADVTGDAGSPQFAKAPVSLTLRGDHLPAAPQASLQGSFRLAGAPATLQADVTTNDDGGLHVVLKRADWKSLAARADMVLPKGEKIPAGTLDIRMAQIGDAAALAGQDITGGLTAKLTSSAHDAKIVVQGSNLAAGPRRIASLSLTGAATGVEADPTINALLTLTGIDANAITGNATVTANGRQSALQLRAHAGLQNVQNAPANVDIAAVLNGNAKQLTLQTVTASWKTLALRLLGPARVEYGGQIAVDHVRLGVNQAQIALAGRLSPTLDLTASLHNVTPELAKAVLPDLQAAGVVTADARLTGTTASPNGIVHLTATGLRLRSGPAASLPPAQIAAVLHLNGATAGLDAHVDAGPKLHLAASGTVPLSATGPLALRTRGSFDVALLNPVLQAGGREARGRATVDLSAGGSVQAPRMSGNVTLAGGEIQDFTQGVHLTAITARIDAEGNTLRIARFTANAAPGTLAVTGTVGVLAPGLPVDLRITARNARPLASDLLTAQFDADLTVLGQAAGDMRAAGKILLHRVEINVPDSFPPSVAVLNVRRPGDKPPPPASAAAPPPGVIHLDVVVDAPRNIFVRGHGLDAELGGKLTVGGIATAPQISGGFDMRRGDFSLAGTTLNFSKGTVGFDGTGVSGKIDPTLNFEADSYQGGITATLKVTGYADGPKIALSSVPDLPQDEVLAHLLFGQSMKQLTPIQIAEIGAALAELSGVTGGGNPLNAIRKGLGLDRLNVGGGTNGAGASVEAGRYVATGVYVGAKQSTSGAGGTQAQVQVDLTRHLKLQTTLGTGGGTAQGATPDNDPGSSVGLAYQFEY